MARHRQWRLHRQLERARPRRSQSGQIAGVGDFNGDGHDDILWRDTDGTVTNWLGTANGGFTDNWSVLAREVPNWWQVQPDNLL